MVPFRVFNRETKNMWVVLNYQPGTAPNDRGTYLVAREDDNEKDGEMASEGMRVVQEFNAARSQSQYPTEGTH